MVLAVTQQLRPTVFVDATDVRLPTINLPPPGGISSRLLGRRICHIPPRRQYITPVEGNIQVFWRYIIFANI